MRMLFTVFGTQTGQLLTDDLHVKDVRECVLIALIYVINIIKINNKYV